MKDEYDLSRAERGRFFREGATSIPPIHLDADVRAVPTAKAERQGVTLDDLVNAMLREDIEPTECAMPS